MKPSKPEKPAPIWKVAAEEQAAAATKGDLNGVIHATTQLEAIVSDAKDFQEIIAVYGIEAAAEAGQIGILRFLLVKVGEPCIDDHKIGFLHALGGATHAKPQQHRVIKWLIARGVSPSISCCCRDYIDDRGEQYTCGSVARYAWEVEDLLRIDIREGLMLRPEAAAAIAAMDAILGAEAGIAAAEKAVAAAADAAIAAQQALAAANEIYQASLQRAQSRGEKGLVMLAPARALRDATAAAKGATDAANNMGVALTVVSNARTSIGGARQALDSRVCL